MKYTIIYHPSWKEIAQSDDIESVKKEADENADFTEMPIIIEDENGNEIFRREWNSIDFEEGMAINPIVFCSDGFYGDWEQ